MAFLVLAFPEIDAGALYRIQAYRQQHDKHYHIVAPHFTLVFPTDITDEKTFVDEIRKQAQGTAAIELEIDKAIVHKDDFQDFFHEFLVPDKGAAAITTLHDRLYADVLAPAWRKDIPYIPHISIGQSASEAESRKRTAGLPLPTIAGTIKELSVASYKNGVLIPVAVVALQ